MSWEPMDEYPDFDALARRRTAQTCDRECMGANHCNGFKPCAGCGEPTCGAELNEDGYCESCAERREAEQEDVEPQEVPAGVSQ